MKRQVNNTFHRGVAFTPKDIIDIRHRAYYRLKSVTEEALTYGVANETIRKIIRFETFKHVGGAGAPELLKDAIADAGVDEEVQGRYAQLNRGRKPPELEEDEGWAEKLAAEQARMIALSRVPRAEELLDALKEEGGDTKKALARVGLGPDQGSASPQREQDEGEGTTKTEE